MCADRTTLTPGTYEGDAVDAFWLDRREGFCEHYAAAFVVVMRAMGVPARIVTGYQGTDVLALPPEDRRKLRGGKMSMIFQEPMTSLNPLHTIEAQIGEILSLHQGISGSMARARTLELLTQVGIPDPETRLGSYPHQLSGGQRQRVMIAMALANEPDLLIADEPTTALDVTTQMQILRLVREHLGMDVVFVAQFVGDNSVFRHVEARPGRRVMAVGEACARERSYCQRVVDGPDQVRSQHIDWRADRTLQLQAEHLVANGSRLVKADGEQIHLG